MFPRSSIATRRLTRTFFAARALEPVARLTVTMAGIISGAMPTSKAVLPASSATPAAIRPNSVRVPVWVTTPSAEPWWTIVPMKAQPGRSWGEVTVIASTDLVTGSDSPVRTASSHCRSDTSTRRRSAGTMVPMRKTTTSPGTRSATATSTTLPSRRTWALRLIFARSDAIATSAAYSLMNPSPTLSATMTAMITPLVTSPVRAETNAAPSRRMRIGLRSWRTRTIEARTLRVVSRLGPPRTRRSRAAAEVSPAGSLARRVKACATLRADASARETPAPSTSGATVIARGALDAADDGWGRGRRGAPGPPWVVGPPAWRAPRSTSTGPHRGPALVQAPGSRATSARRAGTTRHHVQRPRRSPVMSPASARTRVWCETVGWLLPRGSSSAQLQTSSPAAISESMRRRTGSANAPKIRAISSASGPLSAPAPSALAQPTLEAVGGVRIVIGPILVLTAIDVLASLSSTTINLGGPVSRLQLALNVADLDEAIDFYTRFFDTAPAKVRPGYANFAVENPPLKLVLFENPGAAGSINHLDVEESTTCCYAVQDKVWVDGPDASRWEVYTVLADAPGAAASDGTCRTPSAPVEVSLGAAAAAAAPACC